MRCASLRNSSAGEVVVDDIEGAFFADRSAFSAGVRSVILVVELLMGV
jgi:hypothetical protein